MKLPGELGDGGGRPPTQSLKSLLPYLHGPAVTPNDGRAQDTQILSTNTSLHLIGNRPPDLVQIRLAVILILAVAFNMFPPGFRILFGPPGSGCYCQPVSRGRRGNNFPVSASNKVALIDELPISCPSKCDVYPPSYFYFVLLS